MPAPARAPSLVYGIIGRSGVVTRPVLVLPHHQSGLCTEHVGQLYLKPPQPASSLLTHRTPLKTPLSVCEVRNTQLTGLKYAFFLPCASTPDVCSCRAPHHSMPFLLPSALLHSSFFLRRSPLRLHSLSLLPIHLFLPNLGINCTLRVGFTVGLFRDHHKKLQNPVST